MLDSLALALCGQRKGLMLALFSPSQLASLKINGCWESKIDFFLRWGWSFRAERSKGKHLQREPGEQMELRLIDGRHTKRWENTEVSSTYAPQEWCTERPLECAADSPSLSRALRKHTVLDQEARDEYRRLVGWLRHTKRL